MVTKGCSSKIILELLLLCCIALESKIYNVNRLVILIDMDKYLMWKNTNCINLSELSFIDSKRYVLITSLVSMLVLLMLLSYS